MSATSPPPKRDSPPLLHRPNPSYPGSLAPQHQSVFANWERLTSVLGRTIPTQDVEIRRMVRRIPAALRYGGRR